MSLKKSRQSITRTLQSKLDEKSALHFENEIYKMCLYLSKEYDDTLEDIYNKFAYEKVGDIMNADGEEDRNGVLNDIKNGILGWKSAPYKEFRRKLEKDNSEIAKSISIEEGDLPCRNAKCGSKRCISYLSQDRSGDEGMTQHVICVDCRTHYTIN